MRKFTGTELILASHNKGKIAELSDMLKPYGITIRSGRDLDVQDPEETEDTFLGNATLKAKYFAEKTGLPSLADDSGLCVHAIGDRPGVFTARFAPTAVEGFEKINAELGANPDRSAHFACCLVLAWPDGHTESFIGRVDGTIALHPRGDNGFAYDICFIPNGYDRTFAQMTREEKAPLSHRGKALQQFIKHAID
ncbi:MAG: RdgB/HAM1 family non-canonical purine NTP pyrophosphatase [Lactobacillales bacterium]|jgi:XTP/dITP diphosphohydrolase|nr:RdgB/HAM1 family non-canonical purine NTP pyrophosphatase [Lactobacillales bacterium]